MALSPQRRNARTVTALVAIVLVMIGLSFASVPLYRLFCEATGYNGTTQRATPVPKESGGHALITMRFAPETAADLGWGFRPLQASVRGPPGAERVVATG